MSSPPKPDAERAKENKRPGLSKRIHIESFHRTKSGEQSAHPVKSSHGPRILTYNTVDQHFDYVNEEELAEYPRGQLVEVTGLGWFCRSALVVLGQKDGVTVTAKIDFPPDIQAAHCLGKWKKLFVIKGIEGMTWKYA